MFRKREESEKLADTLFDPQQLPQTVEAQWWRPAETKVAGDHDQSREERK